MEITNECVKNIIFNPSMNPVLAIVDNEIISTHDFNREIETILINRNDLIEFIDIDPDDITDSDINEFVEYANENWSELK